MKNKTRQIIVFNFISISVYVTVQLLRQVSIVENSFVGEDGYSSTVQKMLDSTDRQLHTASRTELYA